MSVSDHSPRGFKDKVPSRLAAMYMPDRAPRIGVSVKEADTRVIGNERDSEDLLDTTHFDVVRFPPPPWALSDFVAAAGEGRFAYTPHRGHRTVRAAVSPAISRLLGVEVDPDAELVLTPGTQAGLFAALAALIDVGDVVLIPDPDYLYSERILRFLGAAVRNVPLTVDAHGVTLDLEAIEDGARRGARVLLLSHPNNPTGAVLPPATISAIAQIAQATGMTVVVDELYCRLVYDDIQFAHLVAEPGMRDGCITLLGPSKTESLSGYRIGAVVAPRQIVDRVEDVLSITSLRAPAYAQHVLKRWLTDDEVWLRERLVELRRLRDHTVRRLTVLPWLRVHPQQATAYLFPDASALGLPDWEVARRLVTDARVLVNPGYQFGPRGSGSFRICYARDEAAWDPALTRMISVLAGLGQECERREGQETPDRP